MNYDLGPYDPCPCGSGAKYKFCCAAKAKANRHGKFPIGTVAFYGPDDKTTTKIVAGVVLREFADPLLQRWVGTNVSQDEKVATEIKQFFASQGVKTVVLTSGNLGCPHEEGPDFPIGHDCPFCPYWAGKQGSARRDDAYDFDDFPAGEFEEGVEAKELDAEDDEGDEELDADKDDQRDLDSALARIEAILGGDDLDFDQAAEIYLAHLKSRLQLPCEVTGIEDFRWEEPYVLGGWSPREYARLKRTQPSYTDRYELLAIGSDEWSRWMMFDEDIPARVRRSSDGREFILGLAELQPTDKNSPNYQYLDDYSIWLVNSR
jgi:hypothetical protein